MDFYFDFDFARRSALGTSCKLRPVNSGQWNYYVGDPQIPTLAVAGIPTHCTECYFLGSEAV